MAISSMRQLFKSLLVAMVYVVIIYFISKLIIPKGAYFTTLLSSIGMIFLVFSSPGYKISEGLRSLRFTAWFVIIFLGASPFVAFHQFGERLEFAVLISISTTTLFIGWFTFGARMSERRKRKKNGSIA